MISANKKNKSEAGGNPLALCLSWFRDKRAGLFAYAQTHSESSHDAEEILSDALQKVAAALGEGRVAAHVDDLTYYALRVIRNLCINKGSRVKRRRELEQRYYQQSQVEESEQLWQDLPSDAEELRRSVQGKLLELPPPHRELVVLRIWQELTFAAIAQLLDEPESTIRSRYQVAITKLRRLFSDSTTHPQV